jgi:hypothetical protein
VFIRSLGVSRLTRVTRLACTRLWTDTDVKNPKVKKFNSEKIQFRLRQKSQ